MRARHPFPDLELDWDSYHEPRELVVTPAEYAQLERELHPDAVERGTAVALGFMPHRDANRKQRLTGVATFEQEGVSRRELWEQRKRQRRGKLDPELRRAQRKAGAK